MGGVGGVWVESRGHGMKERPILFNGPMVRALLNGSKTQTRQVAKLTDAAHIKEPRGYRRWHPADPEGSKACPYGKPGDQLWVRERHRFLDCGEIDYFADGAEVWERMQDHIRLDGAAKWRPSIHMPRTASRITLEITGARVERLQYISEADALAEGCTKNHNGYFWGGHHPVSGLKQMATAEDAYRDLWESINGPGSWDTNPWVWAVEFKRLPA